MTGRDKPKGLWADYQDDEPEPGGDRARLLWAGHDDEPQPEDDLVRPAPDEAEELPRPDAQQPIRRGAVVLGLLAGVIAFALATALPSRGSVVVDDVPSSWEDVRMRCHTARVEQEEGALELFRCRALGGGELPPGFYRSPDTQWRSDITRGPARVHEISITADGELTGWAAY